MEMFNILWICANLNFTWNKCKHRIVFEITGKVMETSKRWYSSLKPDIMMPPLEPISRAKPKAVVSKRKRQRLKRTPTFPKPSINLPKPQPVVQSSSLTPFISGIKFNTASVEPKVSQMPPLEKEWCEYYRSIFNISSEVCNIWFYFRNWTSSKHEFWNSSIKEAAEVSFTL